MASLELFDLSALLEWHFQVHGLFELSRAKRFGKWKSRAAVDGRAVLFWRSFFPPAVFHFFHQRLEARVMAEWRPDGINRQQVHFPNAFFVRFVEPVECEALFVQPDMDKCFRDWIDVTLLLLDPLELCQHP